MSSEIHCTCDAAYPEEECASKQQGGTCRCICGMNPTCYAPEGTHRCLCQQIFFPGHPDYVDWIPEECPATQSGHKCKCGYLDLIEKPCLASVHQCLHGTSALLLEPSGCLSTLHRCTHMDFTYSAPCDASEHACYCSTLWCPSTPCPATVHLCNCDAFACGYPGTRHPCKAVEHDAHVCDILCQIN